MPTPPSFSSFPPSFSSFPDIGVGGSSGKDTETATSSTLSAQPRNPNDKGKESSHRKRKRDKQEKTSSLGRVHLSERGSGRRSRELQDNGQAAIDERTKAEEDSALRTTQHDVSRPVFFSDKKGDPLSMQYGGINSSDIPKYHLIGYGRKVLGLPQAWTVVRRSNRSVEAVVGRRQKLPGISDAVSRRLLETTQTRRLVASAEASRKYQETDGVIPLPSRRARPIDPEDYRSLGPSKNHGSESDSSSESAISDDDGDQDTTALSSNHEKMRSLEEELSNDPTSVPTWLSLLSLSLCQVPAASKNASKVRSEITLSILSRALPTLPKKPSPTRLHLMYLHAGEELWTNEKLHNEWEKALTTRDINIALGWLDWQIRNGSSGVQGVFEAANRVLTFASSELEILRVFWRVTCVLYQAGFTERSMAFFQAQADLAGFHNPPVISQMPFEEQLNNLEEYWDLEAPRMGESGSTGWADWYIAGKPERTPGLAASSTSSSLTPGAVASSLPDPYQRWAQGEMRSDELLRYPLRSTDPDTGLDPYATILFSDIRPFLFALTSNRAKSLFRLMWMSHLGLHVPGLEAMVGTAEDDRWTQLRLVSKSYIEAIFSSSTDTHCSASESHAGVLIGREKQYMDSFGPIKNWSYRCLGPFEASEFRNGKVRWAMWTKEDIAGVDVELVRRIFEQCRMGDDDMEWDLLALGFEAAIDVKGALKKSRRFLASAPESLPHWAAHARLERLRGRLDEARKVYQTVLSSPASTRSRLSAGPLWWDWAEMEWLAGDSEAATSVVLRAAEVEGLSMAILRGKRALEGTAREIPETLWKVREAWIRLGALLDLLTAQSLPSFLMAPLETGTVVQESMAVASLGMLYHHISTLKSPTRPAVLRERLGSAVELFPDNTTVLGMFLEMQKGHGLWGGVRKLGEAGTSGDLVHEKGVSRCAAEVWLGGWEKGQWSWEVERIRGSLTTAIKSERTRGSPVLWRLLLELEIRAGDLERAKNVLLQAIGECPLVKDIYMEAFNRVRPVFSPHELYTLWETMVERGLRIRKGLEEFEGLGDTKGPRAEDDAHELDEIEYNSRELARLKPY